MFPYISFSNPYPLPHIHGRTSTNVILWRQPFYYELMGASSLSCLEDSIFAAVLQIIWLLQLPAHTFTVSLSLGYRDCVMEVPRSDRHSSVICHILTWCGSVVASVCCRKRLPWWEVRAVLTHGCLSECLQSSWIRYLFSKTIGVGSLLGSIPV